jgi:hypothetical protein
MVVLRWLKPYAGLVRDGRLLSLGLDPSRPSLE